MVVEKPSAANAGDELETDRFCAVPVCSVMAPVEALMVGATPVIAPIFPSKVPTVSLISMLMGVTPMAVVPAVEPVFTKLIAWPFTVMVSPAMKLVVSELLGDVPDSVVAAVIGAGVAALFKAAAPVTVESP